MTLTNDDHALTVTTPNDTDIVLRRVFDAPRRLVFDALTRPDLIRRWHGPRAWALEVCEVDLRVGGAWRFVSRGPDGTEMGMGGVYRAIEAPDRLVHTEVFDEWDAVEAEVTTVLTEDDGSTTMTVTAHYPSRQVRDGVVDSNMESGAGESYDRLAEMLDEVAIAERYRKVADQFVARLRAVPDDAWDNPAPCEGWVTRDVVAHLVEWLPALFFSLWPVEAPAIPPVADDPVGAWLAVDGAIRAALADPEIAGAERDTPMGPSTFARALDMICTPDVLVHTWDLARAAGLDETLDPVEVHRVFVGSEPYDEALRASGHYGPRVPVPDDADEQTQLLAFMGRRS
jgi:uncharacterized protein (TIGR03086 family)